MSVITGGWWEKGVQETKVFELLCGFTTHTPAQKPPKKHTQLFMGVIRMHGAQGKMNATLFPFTDALRRRLAVPTLKPYLPRPSADKIRCHRRSGRTTLATKLHSTIEEKVCERLQAAK